MRSPPFLVAAAPLLVAAVWAGGAHATVVVVPSLEEMAVASDVIAEVEVGTGVAHKEAGRIVTLTPVTIKNAIKGQWKTGERLVIYQLGGTYDGKTAWIAGAHHFDKGEHLVIFAVNSLHQKRYGENVVVPYGIGFGLFKVVDSLTGPQVEEDVGDVVTTEMKPPEVRRYDSLASFENTVRAAIVMKDLPQPPHKKVLAPRLPGRH